MYYTNHYVVDWDKVKTFEDLKLIVKAFNISFEPNYPHLEEIKQFIELKPKENFGNISL